jgi:hypothetical protein
MTGISAPNRVPEPPLPSLDYVNQELKRIPHRSQLRLTKLGVRSDLEQELHLAFYRAIMSGSNPATLRRAIHAAGERLRYREIVRRAKFEVPEELAGSAYHQLMYGTYSDEEFDN